MISQKPSSRIPGSWNRTVLVSLLLFLFIICYVSGPNGNPATHAERDPCTNLETLQQDDPALISCLKKDYLVPPNARPYNLSNPDAKDRTQYGQLADVLSLLNKKRDGFFIECGALDGEYLSNTIQLERNYGWTGLLVEADPSNYKAMTFKHRKAYTSHSCLSPTTNAQKLTLVGIDYGATAGGLTLTKSGRLAKFFANSKRVPVEVQCFPLYTYLLALNRTVVDYFSLDVEGADFEILKTIPFDKIIFKVLEVEVVWVNEGVKAVREFLERRGYIFVKQIVGDFIFIHNSLKIKDSQPAAKTS